MNGWGSRSPQMLVPWLRPWIKTYWQLSIRPSCSHTFKHFQGRPRMIEIKWEDGYRGVNRCKINSLESFSPLCTQHRSEISRAPLTVGVGGGACQLWLPVACRRRFYTCQREYLSESILFNGLSLSSICRCVERLGCYELCRTLSKTSRYLAPREWPGRRPFRSQWLQVSTDNRI